MPNTTYLDTQLNKLQWGLTAYTPASPVYLAASTTTPTQAGTNFTEPVGNNYSRVSVTNNTTNFHAAVSQPGTGQQQNNNATFSFPQASGVAASWGTVTYIGFYDAASNGNLLWYGALTVAQTIGGGDTLSFSADNIQITLN